MPNFKFMEKQGNGFDSVKIFVKLYFFTKNPNKDIKQNKLYSELEKATGLAPNWNFWKYLINQNGKIKKIKF